jgi:hypothetical protein
LSFQCRSTLFRRLVPAVQFHDEEVFISTPNFIEIFVSNNLVNRMSVGKYGSRVPLSEMVSDAAGKVEMTSLQRLIPDVVACRGRAYFPIYSVPKSKSSGKKERSTSFRVRRRSLMIELAYRRMRLCPRQGVQDR